MPQTPLTKSDFYRRFYEGEFGNRNLNWDSLTDWQKSEYADPVAIRTKKVGSRCDYHIAQAEVASRYESFLATGHKPSDLNISAMMLDEQIICQGEVTLLPDTHLLYSRAKKPMREALKESQVATGLSAIMILTQVMDVESLTWLYHLLRDYQPTPVVEFSSYSRYVGTTPRRNTIFWEVRAY